MEILQFIIHNNTKIMYILRHNSDKLYTFNVNNYVDVANILKKRQFYLLERDDGPDIPIDERMTSAQKKKIAFDIMDVLDRNLNLSSLE